MENFIVSARKYRPVTFDTVVGQKSITTTLKNAIKNNHLAQAFLFTGPRGVGKTTCARIMAKTINCQNLSENIEACNECPPCVSFNQSNSFNVHELDAASNNSVDGIRSLVDQVRIPPQVGKYKVYIIDEVHMLSQAAFNAFLKTLEEPPAYAKFILATTEKHKIIPTILSRCQIFDFARITVDDISKHLQFVAQSEGITAEHNALHIIAQKADGALRDALSIFDQIVSFTGNNITYKDTIDNLNVLDYDYYFRITDMIMESRTADILLLLDEIIHKGFEGSDFITGFGGHLRNLLVCKDPATVKLIEVSDDIREKYLLQSKLCPEDFLMQALDINNRADVQYKSSSNKRLTLELALLQIAGALKKKEITGPPRRPEPLIDPQISGSKNVAPSTQTQPVVAASAQPSAPNPVPATPPPAEANVVSESASKKYTADQPSTPAPDPQPKPATSNGIRYKKPLTLKINQSTQDEDEDENEESSLVQEDRPQDDFSMSNFIKIWKKLAESMKDESHSLFVAMSHEEPRLLSNFTIEVTLDNPIQEESLHERKSELLSHLRKELNNYSIQITTRIREATVEQKAYLPADKFKKLTDKNPEIIRLQKDLDLDFIY
jgi:DNA polymerase III subunit gamma/tau